MIIEFVIGLVLTWTFTYFLLKLYDQYKMKKIRKKYPEGTETVSKPVKRLDDIPTPFPENKPLPVEISTALKTLKEAPKEFPEVSEKDIKEEK